MKYLLLIFFVIVLLTACEDLPKPTTSGEQTFGCRIDGKRWVPLGRSGNTRPPILTSVSSYSPNTVFTISAYLGNQDIFLIVSQPNIGVGRYLLGRRLSLITVSHNSGAFATDAQTGYPSGEFTTDSLHTGEINITRFDSNAKIVSGTFYFTGYDSTTGRTMTVEDGRFDLKY